MTDQELTEDKTTIFNFLLETGCCKRCALRFIGHADPKYDRLDEEIKKLCKDLDQIGNQEHTLKRSKINPCIVCLDLLHNLTLESMILRPEIEKIGEYDCDTFISYISYPSCIFFREHSMNLFLKEKFPNFLKDRQVIPINRMWSLAIQNTLAEKVDKKFDRNSPLQVQFTTSYNLEVEECSVIYQLQEKLKKSNGNGDLISKTVICEVLEKIDPEIFKKHVQVPPQTSTQTVIPDQVSYKHDFVYLAGRYCKYSRTLFQTPWIDDEGVVIKGSVQEIVFHSLDNIFKCSNMIFSSSGREDFDVRTLGRGRPFFIKICDPKVTKIPPETFRLVEETIKKSKVVEVRDLQIIDKKYVNNIKDGEQFKSKTYQALCIVDKPEDVPNYIEKINSISKVTLKQRTPLRVYHRRSSDVRDREIYSLKARPVPGRNNLFELDMVTQAGTYVKEFVHGDLGRTTPSLSGIIGGNVDIIALDVLDIDLDFPPALNTKDETIQV